MKLAERHSQQGGDPAVTRSASDAASWSTVSLDVRCPRGVAEACLRVLLKGARRRQVAGASAHQESTTPRRSKEHYDAAQRSYDAKRGSDAAAGDHSGSRREDERPRYRPAPSLRGGEAGGRGDGPRHYRAGGGRGPWSRDDAGPRGDDS